MNIEEIKHYSNQIREAVNDLLPQLSSSATSLDENAVKKIIESEAIHLLMAKEKGEVCGMLTLAVYCTPTGIRAWIEDVVVRAEARGKGVGSALVKAALEVAKSHHATKVDLTSRPSREEANRLYQKIGFEKRETNLYRIHL